MSQRSYPYLSLLYIFDFCPHTTLSKMPLGSRSQPSTARDAEDEHNSVSTCRMKIKPITQKTGMFLRGKFSRSLLFLYLSVPVFRAWISTDRFIIAIPKGWIIWHSTVQLYSRESLIDASLAAKMQRIRLIGGRSAKPACQAGAGGVHLRMWEPLEGVLHANFRPKVAILALLAAA